jgi:hypothetical protein
MNMKKNSNLIALEVTPAAADSTAAAAGSENAVPAQKRGFKPRWLRLQRRERKLREARAMALRPVVG